MSLVDVSSRCLSTCPFFVFLCFLLCIIYLISFAKAALWPAESGQSWISVAPLTQKEPNMEEEEPVLPFATSPAQKQRLSALSSEHKANLIVAIRSMNAETRVKVATFPKKGQNQFFDALLNNTNPDPGPEPDQQTPSPAKKKGNKPMMSILSFLPDDFSSLSAQHQEAIKATLEGMNDNAKTQFQGLTKSKKKVFMDVIVEKTRPRSENIPSEPEPEPEPEPASAPAPVPAPAPAPVSDQKQADEAFQEWPELHQQWNTIHPAERLAYFSAFSQHSFLNPLALSLMETEDADMCGLKRGDFRALRHVATQVVSPRKKKKQKLSTDTALK
jgi:hypothetical protein